MLVSDNNETATKVVSLWAVELFHLKHLKHFQTFHFEHFHLFQ